MISSLNINSFSNNNGNNEDLKNQNNLLIKENNYLKSEILKLQNNNG